MKECVLQSTCWGEWGIGYITHEDHHVIKATQFQVIMTNLTGEQDNYLLYHGLSILVI